MQNDNNKLCG